MTKQTVLVGCPTAVQKQYCLHEYAAGIHALTYDRASILLVDNSPTDHYIDEIQQHNLRVIKGLYIPDVRERIVQSRNLLRQYVLDHGYDYFLSLEQDVIPPPDVIQTLLSHQKEIVGGVVLTLTTENGKDKVVPLLYKEVAEKPELMQYITSLELKSARLIPLKACSLGCLLIHRDVLQKIPFRHDGEAFDDVLFCHDARALGYQIYVDTFVKPKHAPRPWNHESL